MMKRLLQTTLAVAISIVVGIASAANAASTSQRNEGATLTAWLTQAEKGLPKAQLELGHLYSKGEGVRRDPKAAAKWYKLAATQSHTPAYFHHGVALLHGLGGEKDAAQATKWLTKAAYAQGGYATYLVGRIHRDGNGVEKNFREAYKWFYIGAIEGIRQSQIARKILSARMTPGAVLKAQKAGESWLANRKTPQTASRVNN